MSADRLISDVCHSSTGWPGLRSAAACPPIGSFPTSATHEGCPPCPRARVSADRLISDVCHSPRGRTPVLVSVSADRLISDVCHSSNIGSPIPVESCPPIGSFPTSATGGFSLSFTRQFRVRRSAHFRRLPRGERRGHRWRNSVSADRLISDVCHPRGQGKEIRLYVSADRLISDVCHPEAIKIYTLKSVSADRLISDVCHNLWSNGPGVNFSVRRSAHFRRLPHRRSFGWSQT